MAGNTVTVELEIETSRPLHLSLGALSLVSDVMDLIPDWHVEEKEKMRRRGELLISEIKAELVARGSSR